VGGFPPDDPGEHDSGMELTSIPEITKVKDTTIRPFVRSPEASQYRDPLHRLLDHIAEASRTCLAFWHCCIYKPDHNIPSAADT
jgi:hypothetical protein